MNTHSKLLTLAAAALLLAACAGSGKKTMSCAKPERGYYCVQAGDTLARISQRFGATLTDLQQWNGIKNNQIRVGQLLRVSAAAKRYGNLNTQPNTASAPVQLPAQTQPPVRMQMPVAGFIVSPYTPQNYGIDIAAQRGMPVLAAAAGTVLYTGEEVPGYGRLVLVRHNNALITAYAHNDSYLVAPQTQVQAGQPIATVGGQNKLHFEVRVNNKAVNPEIYLR